MHSRWLNNVNFKLTVKGSSRRWITLVSSKLLVWSCLGEKVAWYLKKSRENVYIYECIIHSYKVGLQSHDQSKFTWWICSFSSDILVLLITSASGFLPTALVSICNYRWSSRCNFQHQACHFLPYKVFLFNCSLCVK